MTNNFTNIKECKINKKILRLLPLDNNDLLALLNSEILCLKNPDYILENALHIIIEDSKLYSICLWKDNQILVNTSDYLYLIQLYDNNTKYKINIKKYLYTSISLRPYHCQCIMPLNNYTKVLLNKFGQFAIFGQLSDKTFQSEFDFKNIKSFQSFIQIRNNEIVCNSENEKKVYFIDISKALILKVINNIQTFYLDIDVFCIINNNILGMAGDLRSGIYFFDINQRELIYQFKEDWRGYHTLLNIGKNLFLGESYAGRSYAESDDEDEELYCTKFFKYDEKENKIKAYKFSNDRIAELKRINFKKFNNLEKIAYVAKRSIFIEDI